jgi:predicted metal-dependent hydrolase
MSPRERDASGRPLNARPRDGLGRPLPRGNSGVARVPDQLVLPPARSLAEAQRLLDEGMPFHAHEVLEGTWKAAPELERDLWQGLAQLAVGLTHLLRGNDVGASAVLRRGRERIAGYAGAPPYDIDVRGLIAWADALLDQLADPSRMDDAAGAPVTPRLLRP